MLNKLGKWGGVITYHNAMFGQLIEDNVYVDRESEGELAAALLRVGGRDNVNAGPGGLAIWRREVFPDQILHVPGE